MVCVTVKLMFNMLSPRRCTWFERSVLPVLIGIIKIWPRWLSL